MNPEGSVKFECNRCTNILTYSGSEIELEAFASHERGMGAENGYRGECTYICPTCENKIHVEHEAWEYPIGMFNYGDTKVQGAQIIEGFKDLDFAFEEDMYSFDEDAQIYLPEPQPIITNLQSGVLSLISEIKRTPNLIYRIQPREF